MQLEFEIKNSKIERKDTNVLIQDNIEELTCSFFFLTPEWRGIERYAVFWDNNNKSTIISIGKKRLGSCKLPNNIIKEKLFAVQIYANDNLSTQKLKVETVPYTHIEKQKNKNKCGKRQQIKEEYNSKKIFNEIFKKLNSKVDSITYDDGYLRCYAGEQIIYSEPIFKNIIDDIREIVRELNNAVIENIILNEDKVICYSEGQILYEIPFSTTSFADIAWSGDYNDLKNKPNEFNPSPHTHEMVDVIDYEENIGVDLNILLDFLSDEINKE